jgi:hypothetical protein
MRRHRLGLEDGDDEACFEEAETEDGVAGNAGLVQVCFCPEAEAKEVTPWPTPAGAFLEIRFNGSDGRDSPAFGGEQAVALVGMVSRSLVAALDLFGCAASAACSFGPLSSFLPDLSSRLALRVKRRKTDCIGEGASKVVGKSHESTVPCNGSEGCLRRSRR